MKKGPTQAQLLEAAMEFQRRNDLTMDEEDVARKVMRDSSLATLQWILRGYRVAATYDGNRLLAHDCFCVAVGWGDLIGCHSATQLSIKYFSTPKHKWTVGKIIKQIQDVMFLDDGLPGQRSAADRRAMFEARNGQLK